MTWRWLYSEHLWRGDLVVQVLPVADTQKSFKTSARKKIDKSQHRSDRIRDSSAPVASGLNMWLFQHNLFIGDRLIWIYSNLKVL